MRYFFTLLAGLAVLCNQVAIAQTDRPNFVLVLVDDAALMDFGAYGGEARTPNIDTLAQRGALFTHYRTSPLCAPSRAMLLTGLDNHRNGIATIPEVLPPEHVGQPGYGMSLSPGVQTIADRLKAAGYRTLMSGKWHLGSKKGDLPDAHGFDRSFALDASGADNWEDKSYMPFYRDAPWYEDGKSASLPDDFYSSRFIVDKMIEYIGDKPAETPFFAYVSFQAIHIPVQAPPEFTRHYDGVYDDGWHALRARRHRGAIAHGLISEGAPLAPMPPGSRQWDALTDSERAVYSARMQVNAGMLESMDWHLGRLVAHLEATGDYDRTVFIITSDNGPEPSRGDDDRRLEFWMRLNGYHINEEGIGERGSWGFIGPEWANAAASPSALYKFYASEGGLRVPLIIAGPGIMPQRTGSTSLVTDVAPTLLDMAGLDGAHSQMTGRSLLPVLQGINDHTYGPEDPIGMEVSGNSALYKGKFKITRNIAPIGDGQWRLYDLGVDPGEANDLSNVLPDTKTALLADYAAYAKAVGVLDMPEGYDSVQQITANTEARLLRRYGWLLVLTGLALTALLYGIWRATTRLFRRNRDL
jgi:arylsulfatase A-like enzyme